ncbi:hypothetical protein GBAR_LOCUS4538, partial [Geodia barretti]
AYVVRCARVSGRRYFCACEDFSVPVHERPAGESGKFTVAGTRCLSTMQDRILTLFFLIVVTQFCAAQQGNSRCLLSRLSCPSKFADMTDKYYVYFTKLRSIRCNSTTVTCCERPRKPNFVAPKPITTVGTENTKIIYSPGFIRRKAYPNELYVEYNINCKEGDQAFFSLTYFRLQGKECGDGMCEDFITVDRGDDGFGTQEVCGNSTNPTLVLQLQQSGNFKVKFRTSESNRYPGFEMYIICFPNPKGTGRRKRSCNNHPTTPPPPPPTDPVPTPRELIELNKMNDVLFNAIPESDDISFEDIEDFSGAGSGTVSDPGTEFIIEDQRMREGIVINYFSHSLS